MCFYKYKSKPVKTKFTSEIFNSYYNNYLKKALLCRLLFFQIWSDKIYYNIIKHLFIIKHKVVTHKV